MKLLFLRSQLVDVEFGVRNGADFGDVQLRFDAAFGNRLAAGSVRRGGGFWFRIAGGRTRRGRGRFGSEGADCFSYLVFERASRAGLEGHGRETCQNFESSGERGCSGLGAKHRGKRVGGLAAGTSSDNVVDGLLKLLAGALNVLYVVAANASNGLFDRVGFRCHTR